MTDFERYDEIHDETLRQYIQSLFTDTYVEGWNITEIVRMPSGKWLAKWSKDPMFTREK